MKKVLVFLLACFACTAMFAQPKAVPTHWTMQGGPECANTNTLLNCVLYINGELAAEPDYEIGVFDQDEICRGAKLPVYVARYDWYYYGITIKGNEGFEYHFRIWDHANDCEVTDLVLDIEETIIWQPGMYQYGRATDPYHLNFAREASGIEKEILGYEESGEDHWYFISSPIDAIADAATVANLIGGEFDFYSFDQTGGDDGNEWRNFEATQFDGFELGKGYLYANAANTTIIFNGTAYTGDGAFELTWEEECEDPTMQGWNLMGNPYNANAAVDKEGYVIEGAVMVANDDMQVGPMEGIMVKATEAGQSVTFTPEETGDKNAMFALNVTSESKLVDRAVVRFGQGNQLPKFQLKESTKLYIPMDGEEYSVVRSEGMGELPVSFKATKNGSYTMCINNKNVSFGYLHLIDNLTGADQDLLANPSYTFEARTTDYTSRFKLVFATANDEDNFAFFSNGSLVISNEGNATLQVVDVTGRIIKCETINGCASVNVDAAPGVYMIRLVNGDNVKVQKVVK